MKDIFTDLYNKVFGFFRKSDKKEESAKEVACNRLKVVLMQDRTNLTPELTERMRKELIELLSKYVEMDKEALELGFEQEGNQMALMLSIPVIRAKAESEIEAALAEEDAKKVPAGTKSEEATEEEQLAEDNSEETVDDETKTLQEEQHEDEKPGKVSLQDKNELSDKETVKTE